MIFNLNVLENDNSIYKYYNKEDNLVLFKYTRGISNLDDLSIKQCRGLIFDKKNSKIVCHSFNSRIEYEDFSKKYPIEDISITKLYDGTMINMFYHNGIWRFSTKSRIDANHSHWNNKKSFYELFTEITNIKFENLNTNFCYSFIIIHKTNQIILKHSENKIYLSLVRNLTNNDIITNDIDVNSLGENIFHLEKINEIESYKELEKKNNELSLEDCGFMITNNINGDRCKLYTPPFLRLKNLLGNDSHNQRKLKLFIRLIKENNIKEYLSYFTNDQDKYAKYIKLRNTFCKYVHKLYFISRNYFIKYPNYLSKFIYIIHDQYKINKYEKKIENPNINIKIIVYLFNNLETKYQYHLLESFLKINESLSIHL